MDGGNDIESRNLEAAAAVYSESESEEVVFDVSATCNEDILIQSDGEIPADDTSDVTDLNDSCEYEDLVHDEESRYRLPPIHDHPGREKCFLYKKSCENHFRYRKMIQFPQKSSKIFAISLQISLFAKIFHESWHSFPFARY